MISNEALAAMEQWHREVGGPPYMGELLAEVRRLKSGRLTDEEFNELCHNLHEQGRPITRVEHEQACDLFRESLFGPDEKLIGPNRCQWCGGEYGEHANDCSHLDTNMIDPEYYM